MKVLIITAFLSCAAIQSFAQLDPDKVLYITKAEKYRRMKNTGAVLTVGGTILTVIGISVLSNSSTNTTYYGGSSHTTTTGNPGGGAAAFLIGTAGMGAGIPLWIVGSHAEKKYKRKLEGIAVKLDMRQQRTGLSLTYRF